MFSFWVLWVLYTNSVHTHTHEFFDEASCRAAAAQIEKSFTSRSYGGIITVCTPKRLEGTTR
jgi:hypothetical protein